MSKAFTKETDEEEDLDTDTAATQIPVGTKNYITPGGADKLRKELKELLYETRPRITEIVTWAAALGDRSENADYQYNKKKLREIDRRIRFLTKRLEAAEIIDPTKVTVDTVRFGASVVVRHEDGTEKTYRIVGIDETDIKRGHISWISPLGAALIKHKPGDFLAFRSPKGEEELEIVSLQYIAIPES